MTPMKSILTALVFALLVVAFPLHAAISGGATLHLAEGDMASDHPLAFKRPEREVLREYLKSGEAKARGDDLSGSEKVALQPGETLPRDLVDKGEPLPDEVRDRLNNTTAGVTELQFDNRLVRVWQASRQIIDVLERPRNGS